MENNIAGIPIEDLKSLAIKYEGNDSFKSIQKIVLKISVAHYARISYNNHNGEIDYQKDIELHDRLLRDHHMSPFEHCARVMFNDEYATFVKGRLEDYTTTMEGYNPTRDMQGWCNNFKGFIQYRYLIENNYDLQNFV